MPEPLREVVRRRLSKLAVVVVGGRNGRWYT
jgi:hypothetical protein